MTGRRRLVRAPASSANLGPGYDVMAAALALQMEVEVSEAGEFSVDAGGLEVPEGRDNLVVRAFESLHPADGLSFRIRSEIPLARGLGSSAAAIVAGLVAADHLYELALGPQDLLVRAAELEGHPDNVAAAIHGGFVICGEDGAGPAAVRFEPPEGLEAVGVIPGDEVSTEAAREAMPAEVPLADAVANVAAASLLVLGLQQADLNLVSRGLRDRLHQPHRRGLYPKSMELLEAAPEIGALGATMSGAGPTLLVWSTWQDTGKVVEELERRCEGWAEVRRLPFSPHGVDVPEL
jgi:homoserine kinase